ncbi:MAG: GTPase domain-containing protein [Candidatus Lokiarchaeota archaeon]|nr:GTPase domain-containing protein [Candidatus Lokiarchaeota archaeon]
MVNIGLLGAVSVGKTTLLRLFVLYVKKNKIEGVQGGKACTVIKHDFSGEAVLNPDSSEKETKTIHPNRVIFKEDDTGKNHTLFAPGGDRSRAVVRMGIITISRIAKQIVAVFACDRPLEEQYDFFNDVRYFPKEIYVCFNKFDLIPEDDKEKFLSDLEENVTDFFAKRKITVRQFFRTCAETNEEYNSYNDNAAEMMLKIAVDN